MLTCFYLFLAYLLTTRVFCFFYYFFIYIHKRFKTINSFLLINRIIKYWYAKLLISIYYFRSQILELCCSICHNPFPPKKKGTAKCVKCSARICKIRCSTRDPTGKWLCFTCKHQFSWIQEVIVTISSGFKAMRCVLSSNLTQVYEIMDEDKLKKQDKYIRSCIEEKISAILGETVDDASVFRIYNDESCNYTQTLK